jgi:hypothetical protein
VRSALECVYDYAHDGSGDGPHHAGHYLLKEPIEGRLRRDGGNKRTFTGYMQLVTALEAALGEARGAGGPRAVSAMEGPHK